MSWKVTVRHGPEVKRERFASLEGALGFAREAADRVRREGRLPDINALREILSDQRVHARIEVSGKGLLRGPEAGLDVKGDGSVVPYRGAISKEPLEADSLDDAVARVREALSGQAGRR
jgi:hypothetical protein